MDKPFAQVILGIRRVGKSTIIKQLLAKLIERGIDSRQILFFSFDRYSVEKTPEALETVLKYYFTRIIKKKIYELSSPCYIFIDEIQYIDYWQDIIKRLYDQNKRVKFILTGSQSTKLIGKSKESLAGRLLEHHIEPLSFADYLLIKGGGVINKPAIFDLTTDEFMPAAEEFKYHFGAETESEMPAYLCCGQFPEMVKETDLDLIYRYIRESVLGKILENDLPAHYKFENIEAFKAMGYQLITNSGSLFELKNLGSDLGISKVTVEKYFGYLQNSTLVNVLSNQTKTGAVRGRSLKKAYAGSTCFISAINRIPPDFYDKAPEIFGKIVETHIWRQLLQRFEKVSFWRKRQEEIDFIITDTANNLIIPVEVKFTKRIRPNDLQPMLRYMQRKKIKTGYILTRDRVDIFNLEGKQFRLIPYYAL